MVKSEGVWKLTPSNRKVLTSLMVGNCLDMVVVVGLL